jgi:hypothetical protein
MSVVFQIRILQEKQDHAKEFKKIDLEHLSQLKKKLVGQLSTVDIKDVFDKRIVDGKIIETVKK